MDNFKLNEALLFTADYFNKSNHNLGKPVFLHTVKIMHLAIQLGYNEIVVLSSGYQVMAK
ncbi:hypothetical protein llh_5255 [Lactococcus cremoris subsp. cremoris A76]|uniref:hypothetical protein n=1 Tax=Lactococcus lactis subsp. cremoris TaxID=1359 RepID=UPI000238C346|nr:hypothetical protein [Lactococcus cremoris]AEU40227.1 hypothetical protein llh_5255 [Lactococcus cremoris subsp. cremoris A76]